MKAVKRIKEHLNKHLGLYVYKTILTIVNAYTERHVNMHSSNLEKTPLGVTIDLL